jgi:hypothetical protein
MERVKLENLRKILRKITIVKRRGFRSWRRARGGTEAQLLIRLQHLSLVTEPHRTVGRHRPPRQGTLEFRPLHSIAIIIVQSV